MTVRRTPSSLGSLFFSMAASVVFLLGVLFMWTSAEGAARASEASPVGFGRQDQHAIQLPNGMDPMDVVRMVEKSTEGVTQDTSGLGSAQKADELGSAFQIGGAPVYGPAQGDQHLSLSAVGFDGTNYLVVWMDSRSGSNWDIYGARVSKSGVVLNPGGIAISTATGDQVLPTVGFDGTNYLVVWTDSRSGSYDIYGARVSVGGVVLDPGGIAISTAASYQGRPAVAFDGTNYFVVWEDYRSGSNWDIYGARVSVAGVVLNPGGIAISTATGDQELPTVGFDGTNYLVVWTDYRSGSNWDIYGARVSVNGSVLDGSGIAISTATNHQWNPAVGFDGTNYLVVWDDARSGSYDIYGARVSRSGTVLDLDGFTGLTFASAVATSSNGCVTLSWQMGVEIPAASFMILRSESLDGEFLAVDVSIMRDSQLSFSGTDCSVVPGKTYWYRIVLVGPAGEESCGPIQVHVDAVPTAYRAYQSYPNPFNPLCTIRYDIARAGRLSLEVFNVDGSVVRTLVDAWREPGVYSEVWDGKGDDGTPLPSGVYFYRLESGDFVATRKMVLLH